MHIITRQLCSPFLEVPTPSIPGVVVGHILMLLSHPESYAFDIRLLDSHEEAHGVEKGAGESRARERANLTIDLGVSENEVYRLNCDFKIC